MDDIPMDYISVLLVDGIVYAHTHQGYMDDIPIDFISILLIDGEESYELSLPFFTFQDILNKTLKCLL